MMVTREQYIVAKLQVDLKGSKGADEPLGIAATGMVDDGEGDDPLRVYGKFHKNCPETPNGRSSEDAARLAGE